LGFANNLAVTSAFLIEVGGNANTKEAMMGTPITEPNPGMTGGELLHGFLAELYHASNPEVKSFITSLCLKWNVHYRETGG
jgi:hypothetical protein